MTRLVKHFDLHQVADTELRVVSDVAGGVLDVIQAEDAVIRGYVARGLWRHSWVDLFVLQDLQSLAGQIGEAAGLPPGGSRALDHRPVINAYVRLSRLCEREGDAEGALLGRPGKCARALGP